MPDAQSFIVDTKIKPHWYYKLRYGKLKTIQFNINIGLRFLKLSLLGICGKITIMETEEITSTAGYKYKAFIISRLPVSRDHKYDTI